MVNDENMEAVISEIAGLDDDQISPTQKDTYSENLRKAVDQVFRRDNNSGMSDQLRANVSRFAAYKAMNITKEVRGELGNDLDKAAHILRTANRTQATEYNTTISRCRTAKQFEQFNSPDNLRLFPNLRWLPSRSADPREAHMLFYNKVWAKDDDFWNENSPGSLWNCKCDWEETDDPVTSGNPHENKSAQGLTGNPATTGEVFSNNHTYIADRTIDEDFPVIIKTMRKSLLSFGKTQLRGMMVKNRMSNIVIKLSTSGIKEYIDQPHQFYVEKNELLRRLPELLKTAEYLNRTSWKGRETHVFKTLVHGQENYLLVNKQDDGIYYFHSITDSEKVLK